MNNSNFDSSYALLKSAYIIESIQHKGSVCSRLHTKNGVEVVQQSPLKLVKQLCKSTVRSYEASKNFSKNFFGADTYKLPLIVNEEFNVPTVFFPLFSPQAYNNIWIDFFAIDFVIEHPDKTTLLLSNNQSITFSIHPSSLYKQICRSFFLYKNYVKNKQIIIPNPFIRY